MIKSTWIEDAYSAAITATFAIVSILIFAQAGYLFAAGLAIGFSIATAYRTTVSLLKKKDSDD